MTDDATAEITLTNATDSTLTISVAGGGDPVVIDAYATGTLPAGTASWTVRATSDDDGGDDLPEPDANAPTKPTDMT